MRPRILSRQLIEVWPIYFVSPDKISHKPLGKAKITRNEVLQYRGKNAASKINLERKGESLCSIRPSGCCNGVDLECFGCHPGLLDMGIPCGQQPIHDEYSSLRQESTRDCFCDSSCIVFDDCCDDHFGACPQFYDGSNQESNQESNQTNYVSFPKLIITK